MGLLKNYHNSFNILTNNKVIFPFAKKLQGWTNTNDAFNFVNNLEDEFGDRQKWLIDYLDNPDDFKVNSDYFRSDEFTKVHNGKHVLFSGCSVTYGIGLYTKELWSYKVYEKMKKDFSVSGYFNLGTPGTGIMDIVSNIFKYINNYGNPDYIFIDVPDLTRFYALHQDPAPLQYKDLWQLNVKNYKKISYFQASCKEDNLPNLIIEELKIYYYQYLMMLETYCQNNNIKLYMFSYVPDCSEFLSETDLSRVFYYSKEQETEYLFEYSQKNKKDKFAIVARDNSHPGTGYHEFWADFIYNEYKKENYV